ncbi:replication factor C [Babesia caballi]|uniref:Replication factor C n=1 Tax=Babesia caballi TaxID=5871 RepID=A0AAV4LN03_BABCB|nr:replication factor C [Babesia caballi]
MQVLNWLSGWKCSRLYNSARVPQQRMQHSERRGKRPLSGDRKPEENVDTDADNRKVLLLGGPAGVGKSTVVNVLARHCGFDVVEINASEDRSKAKILPTIKGIITTNAISKNRPNLCLLEEVDGLHAAEGQVIDAIKELNQKNLIKRPIVCICNDLYHKNLRELRQIAKVVVVESCDTEALKHRLFSIADMEGYKVSDQLVEDLLNLHQNDIRSCITALEFLIKNPGLASNLDTFSKDKTQGLTTFLRDLFNPRSSPQALREGSDAVSATIGLQTLSNLIAENVVKVGTRSLFNAIALFDVMVQGDVIHNSLWMQAALSLVKLMRLKSAFKFILPGTLSSHAYGQRVAKNGAVIRAIRRHAMVASSTLSNSFNVQILPAICSIALAAAGASGSWSSLSRRLEEVDVLWQAFAPIKDDALNRVIRMAVLLQVYGINVIEVKGQLTLDPPLLELSSASRNYIGQELCRIVQQIHNGWGSPASVGRPKHLQGYLQEIGRLGYAAFARKFATEVTDEVEREVKRLCRKNGATVPPITFAELLAQEYSHLAQLLSEGGIDADARTCGVYKFHGEKCGAVRYILNDI